MKKICLLFLLLLASLTLIGCTTEEKELSNNEKLLLLSRIDENYLNTSFKMTSSLDYVYNHNDQAGDSLFTNHFKASSVLEVYRTDILEQGAFSLKQNVSYKKIFENYSNDKEVTYNNMIFIDGKKMYFSKNKTGVFELNELKNNNYYLSNLDDDMLFPTELNYEGMIKSLLASLVKIDYAGLEIKTKSANTTFTITVNDFLDTYYPSNIYQLIANVGISNFYAYNLTDISNRNLKVVITVKNNILTKVENLYTAKENNQRYVMFEEKLEFRTSSPKLPSFTDYRAPISMTNFQTEFGRIYNLVETPKQ